MKNKNSSQTLNLLRFEQVKSESFIFIARIDFLRPVSELFLTHRYHYRLWVSSGQCNKHLYRLFLPNLSKSLKSLAEKGCMPFILVRKPIYATVLIYLCSGLVLGNYILDTLIRIEQIADGCIMVQGVDQISDILAHITIDIPLAA